MNPTDDPSSLRSELLLRVLRRGPQVTTLSFVTKYIFPDIFIGTWTIRHAIKMDTYPLAVGGVQTMFARFEKVKDEEF